MLSINLMNFGEALANAQSNPDKPYIIRVQNIEGVGKIDLTRVAHYKLEGDASREKEMLSYWVKDPMTLTMTPHKPANVRGEDALASDFIDVTQWEFIE